MKIGTACLAAVMRIVLPFACVAGLTATATCAMVDEL